MFWLKKQLDRIEAKLDQLLIISRSIETMSTQVTPNFQALMAQVAQNASVEGSAVQLIQGIAAQLQTALDNGDDAAAAALTTQLATSASALGAAVAANTPAPSAAAAAQVVAATKVTPAP
jgi:hypothetical protein